MLLDQSIDRTSLRVEGELRVADLDLLVSVDSLVIEGGLVTAGSPGTPRSAPLELAVGSVMVDAGGELGLVGPLPSPVSARLAGGAPLGATEVTLEEPTNWRAGDEVLVTPTGHFAESEAYWFAPAPAEPPGATERFALTSVAGAALGLDGALGHRREGVLDAGRPLDLRGTVANLSRTIVVRGRGGDAPVLWVRGTSTMTLHGVRVEGGGAPGIGAVNGEMVADDGALVLRGAVLVDSIGRGVVSTSRSGTTVTDTVVAGTVGHGVWLRGGAEQGATLERNVVVGVRVPATSPSDTDTEDAPAGYSSAAGCGPAAFFVESPTHSLRDNLAADVEGCGYAFRFLSSPDAAFYGTLDYSPARGAWGTFDGNASFATRYAGVAVFGHSPQADERASAPHDPLSTLRTTLSRVSVVGALFDGLAITADRVTLTGATLWGHGGYGLRLVGPDAVVGEGLFVGRLGAQAQPAAPAVLTYALGAAGAQIRSFVDNHLAHYAGAPGGPPSGVLGLVGRVDLAQDRTLESWSGTTMAGSVELGARRESPFDAFDFVGPVLDGPGFGGFPGRWWVQDEGYFTSGHTCDPSPSGGSSSGVLCDGPGYLSLVHVAVRTASGFVPRPEVLLRRTVASMPSLTYPVPALDLPDLVRALAVPAGELVTMTFPDYAATPREVAFDAWGPPGTRAVVRIPYPIETTFVVRGGYWREFSLAPSANAVATGREVYYWDRAGGFLYVPLVGDYDEPLRGDASPYYRARIEIFATGPGLP